MISCLSFNVPVYAQQEDPVDRVKEELNKGVQALNKNVNVPSKWVAEFERGNISIIGWNAQKIEGEDTYLVSYTFKDSPDGPDKGWWWEVNTKQKTVKVVLQDAALMRKYNLDVVNKTHAGLLKGMSEFTVKTVYGEPDKIEDSHMANKWFYNIPNFDDRHLLLEIDIINGGAYDWGLNTPGQPSEYVVFPRNKEHNE